MKPTKKAPAVDNAISNLFGRSRVAVIQAGECMFCDATGITQDSFKDTASVREYSISAICQDCQDNTFGEPE